MKQPLSQKFGSPTTLRTEHDLYETPEIATLELLKVEPLSHIIWEPACGKGAISEILHRTGHQVLSSDLFNYGYGKSGINFLEVTRNKTPKADIVTNPPFNIMLEFCEHAIEITRGKVCMFLRLDFLASKGRRSFLESSPLARIHIFSGRIRIKTPNSEKPRGGVNYAWFIWELSYDGKPTIDWIY